MVAKLKIKHHAHCTSARAALTQNRSLSRCDVKCKWIVFLLLFPFSSLAHIRKWHCNCSHDYANGKARLSAKCIADIHYTIAHNRRPRDILRQCVVHVMRSNHVSFATKQWALFINTVIHIYCPRKNKWTNLSWYSVRCIVAAGICHFWTCIHFRNDQF